MPKRFISYSDELRLLLKRPDLQLRGSVNVCHTHPLACPTMSSYCLHLNPCYLKEAVKYSAKQDAYVVGMKRAVLQVDYHDNLRLMLSTPGQDDAGSFMGFLGATVARMHEEGELGLQVNFDLGLVQLEGTMRSTLHLDRYDAPLESGLRRSNIHLTGNRLTIPAAQINAQLAYMLL